MFTGIGVGTLGRVAFLVAGGLLALLEGCAQDQIAPTRNNATRRSLPNLDMPAETPPAAPLSSTVDRFDQAARSTTAELRDRAGDLQKKANQTVDDVKDRTDRALDRVEKDANATIAGLERRVDKTTKDADEIKKRVQNVGEELDKTAKAIRDLVPVDVPDR